MVTQHNPSCGWDHGCPGQRTCYSVRHRGNSRASRRRARLCRHNYRCQGNSEACCQGLVAGEIRHQGNWPDERNKITFVI